jgi:hypothetical protein
LLLLILIAYLMKELTSGRDKQMCKSFGWIAAGIFSAILLAGCGSSEENVSQTAGNPGPAGISYKPDPSKVNTKGKKAAKPSAAATTSPSKD